jgi:protein-S-isoprenylcysteine O-methyltransferase Ste14
LGNLIFIVPVFILRIPNEEATMLHQFGDEYAVYMNRVGGILPKFLPPRK